jgi:hypothetical protein
VHESSGSEKEFRIFVTYGIDLCEIALIMRSLVDEATATEDLDVVDKAFKEGVVCPAFNVCVVTQTSVGPDHFRECVLEPFRETVRLGGELHDMDEVAELCRAVVEPFGTEAEFRIPCLYMVADLLECVSLVTSCVDVLDREFAGDVPVREFLGNTKLVVCR